MSDSLSLEAIILRRWDYGEKDQIVSFLSREKGRLQGIAKGAKLSVKRFGPALDLFCWIHVNVREKKNHTLVLIEGAQVISNFPRLRQDYASILVASGLLEIAQSLFREGMVEEFAFLNLLEALKQLEEQGAKRRIFWAFLLRNLEMMGWGLPLDVCNSLSSPLASWLRQPEQELSLSSREEAVLQDLLEKHCAHHLHWVPDWNRFLRL